MDESFESCNESFDESFNVTFNETINKSVDELEELRSLLITNQVPVIFIEKPQNDIQSNKIRNLIKEYAIRSSWFDCLEVFNFNQLFGTIIDKIMNPHSNLDVREEFDNNYFNNMNVSNYQNFVDRIQLELKKIKYKNQLIILENADKLIKINKKLIQFLTDINGLIDGIKFTTILISNFKLDHFIIKGIEFHEIYRIEFGLSTIDEIKSIIIEEKPDEFHLGTYSNFVNQIVDSYSINCSDLNKFRYLCEIFFAKFQDEINNGEWVNPNMILNQIAFIKKYNDEIKSNLVYQTFNKLKMVSEMVYCEKYLLIAAYLASYNAQSTDKRFFSRFQVDKQKRKQTAFAKEDKKMGPSKFTFERLYQIYNALQYFSEIEFSELDNMKKKLPTNLIFERFKNFISQKLILIVDSMASHSPYSTASKYCISDFITHETIKELARSVEVDLDGFLQGNLMKQ